jgi:hypothetical protein
MKRFIIAVLLAVLVLLGFGVAPASAAPYDPTLPSSQSISAVCDTGTVTIKNYPANSKVIVRWKPYRGNFETYWTKTVDPFEGDLVVTIKVPPTYRGGGIPWSMSVEFWPGKVAGKAFTWGAQFSYCFGPTRY